MVLLAALDSDMMNFAVRQGQVLARRRIMLYLTVFLAIALSSKYIIIMV